MEWCCCILVVSIIILIVGWYIYRVSTKNSEELKKEQKFKELQRIELEKKIRDLEIEIEFLEKNHDNEKKIKLLESQKKFLEAKKDAL